MIIAILAVVGLCLGSFVNALVWRLHEQSKTKGKQASLSISQGRSMCPHCRHQLAPIDLIPLLSWLSLRGKCRYCGQPISAQYPLVELVTAGLFIASYIWWPLELSGAQVAIFVIWLGLLVGLMALLVYDLRWQLLPDAITYRLVLPAVTLAAISIISDPRSWTALWKEAAAILIGGGLFYLLFQVSKGKWIGGGDVKLGALLGIVAGTPARSLLFIFLGALLGSLVSLPLLASHRLQRNSTIAFGPFLIVGLIITQLFGADLLHWYRQTFIDY